MLRLNSNANNQWCSLNKKINNYINIHFYYIDEAKYNKWTTCISVTSQCGKVNATQFHYIQQTECVKLLTAWKIQTLPVPPATPYHITTVEQSAYIELRNTNRELARNS